MVGYIEALNSELQAPGLLKHELLEDRHVECRHSRELHNTGQLIAVRANCLTNEARRIEPLCGRSYDTGVGIADLVGTVRNPATTTCGRGCSAQPCARREVGNCAPASHTGDKHAIDFPTTRSVPQKAGR